ncbi:helix-turn-helix domain-containing protein [Mucilaginibacter sp.]|uniref:helix-turn-helix domain-containing protein n=1 Tax=Mucilaginibacter sp. TaxID=1882438 RepID=UPI0032653E7B
MLINIFFAELKGQMLYKEYLPHLRLRKYVECYWKFVIAPATNDADAAPLNHIFPPDGSCTLLFLSMASFHHKGMVFVGPTTVIKEIPVFANSITIGVRLKPGCSPWLNKVDVGTIINNAIQYQPYDINEWQQDFLQQLSLDFDEPQVLDNILLKIEATSGFEPDDRVLKAVDFIIAGNGQVTLPEIAAASCASPRQLQRVFTTQTGISIKQFCQLRRLRKAIIDLHVQHRTYPEMVTDRGFADQAHYYKSFKNVAGYDIRKFIGYIGQIEHIMV